MSRHVETNRRFLDERHRYISRIDGITTEFHLGDGAVTARVDNPHPANLSIRVAYGAQYFSLPRINFVLVDVPYFADDRIQLSGLVSAPRQVDQFPNLEFGGGRRLHAAVHVVRVRYPVLGNEPGAVNIRCRRRLETHVWDIDRCIDDSGRIGRARRGRLLGDRQGRHPRQ